MTGQEFLNVLCGSSAIEGLLDKNPDDTKFRATCLQWLNLVLKDIQNRQLSWHWRFLEKTATAPTVASQHTYDPPSDIDTHKIEAIYDRTYDRTYKFKPYDKFIRYVSDKSNDTGQSYIWTWFANSIRLWPVPASIWTFYCDYISLITPLTDTAVSCEIPAKYDPVVIDGVLVYGYRFDPELGDWAKQQALYEGGIIKMIKDNSMMIAELTESQSHRTSRMELGEIAPIEQKTGVWVGS